jgi:two-component system OmpR family sensor kinase
MCSKNKTRHAPRFPAPARLWLRSLRLRLVLWYGSLIAGTLSCFVFLVLFLTADALSQSVDRAVQTEARAVAVEITSELLPTPPYWPARFSLDTLNIYQNLGIVIEVIDREGTLRYASDDRPTIRIPMETDVKRATLTGQSLTYRTSLEHEQVVVQAAPIWSPNDKEARDHRTPGDSTGVASLHSGPVIGTLLVAKSLHDLTTTLQLLQTLLLLSGGVVLAGALLGGWAIAARALQPLTEVVKTARTIAAATVQGTRIGNLSQRVKRSGKSDEIVQVVDALNEMLANLEKATQGQRRFVADASHELRAPLTTIQGNLAFLQCHEETLSPQERHLMVSDAYEETQRLAQLVEELLLLARTDASEDQLPISQEQRTEGTMLPLIDLDNLALQVVRQLRRRLSVEGSALQLEIGHIEPVQVRGDEEKLHRIVLILLDNALKYTTPSGEQEQGCVVVSVQRRGQEAVLCVRDTGIGIDPADLPYIFERFYRADRARQRPGTGLGLSIAKVLVEQCGGRITAESTLGQGSTFSIWLPLC